MSAVPDQLSCGQEVPGEDPPGPYGRRDAPPRLTKFARVAEWEAQAGVDEVSVRQLQVVEGCDDRRQPRAVLRRNRGAKACDRFGRAVDGHDRPAARQQRERLGAVSTAQVDRDQCPIVFRPARQESDRVHEQGAERASLGSPVVLAQLISEALLKPAPDTIGNQIVDSRRSALTFPASARSSRHDPERGSGGEVAVRRGELPRVSGAVCRGRTAGSGCCAPPLRLGGTTHESSEPLLRRMGRRERSRPDPASNLLAAGRRQDGSNAVRIGPSGA